MQPRRPKPFLRHYADDALTVAEAIRDQQRDLGAALEAGDREAELAIRGPLSENYRAIGRLSEAVAHGEAALATARELGKAKAVASNAIRLATAYQYAGRHDEALALFEEASALTRRLGVLHDFALQHMGKCLAELGRIEEARACFTEALALRRARGDGALIASTEEALAALQG